jgi:hypothetical protein
VSHFDPHSWGDTIGIEPFQQLRIPIRNAVHNKRPFPMYVDQEHGFLFRHLPIQRWNAVPVGIDLRMPEFDGYAFLKPFRDEMLQTLCLFSGTGLRSRDVTHIQEYVRGQVHTQGIENFWSLLKRGLNGTYIAVEPFHLHRYVGEQAFRYNNRATEGNPLNDYDRFLLALSQISEKRLTYAELTGKVGETQSGDSTVC